MLLVTTMGLVIVGEWAGNTGVSLLAAATTTVAVALMTVRVGWSRKLYVLIGAALFLATVLALPEWRQAAVAALGSASFIAAFFTA